MRFSVLALTLLCAAACSGEPIAVPTSAFAPDSGVVFEGDKARELTQQCSRAAPGPAEETWTPEAADIAAMEPALATLIDTELYAQWPNEALSASDYRRQYGGLIVGGRRIIYINGFRAEGEDGEIAVWRTWPMIICDGGPITFGVEYDPADGSFSNFAFNGVA